VSSAPDGLQGWVRGVLQERLDEEQKKRGSPHKMTAKSITLTHESGDRHKGIMTIRYRGDDYPVGITVVADGRSMVYELDEGMMAVLARDFAGLT
jgi:hypothetical protein